MAESRQTTGAVHITSLDIDISKAIEDLKTLQEKVQETVDGINNTKPTVGGVGGEDSSSGGIFRTSIAGIESLNLQYRNFLNTLTKSKLEDSKIAKIAEDAQKGADAIKKLTEETKNQTRATPEQKKEYQRLQSELKELKGTLADTEANARRTGEGFKNLGSNADQSAGLVSKFLGALSDKVKWMAAFQVINLIQNAFNNVVGTIRDTEDAVIEIQRVLNDPSLADSTVSQRIYDIAYEYGQTFDNVQEVFTRFAQAGLDFEQATKATEAAMLGLNTAELDVSTATQGLIAIMAQFGYTADDLTSIIDKINITADNFAVTSEKIVAGLQRAGGTAHAFGLTLEETIGIITALSEATGRSGEQIGTALNSLISFSEKASSLSKFSEFLGADASQFGVLELWQKLAEKIRDGDESLAHMMSTSEEFNDLYSEEIASAIGATEEFNKAQMEAQGIYSTVGTYRQNYFIALLNNIDTAIEAMNNMRDAEGYSLSENEKAMSRLTAQWNQLVVAAQELAVQFGEAGFLDLAKLLVNAATGALKLTKSLGGLQTILTAVVGLLLKVKAAKIAEMLDGWRSRFEKLGDRISSSRKKMDEYKVSTDAASTSQASFAATAEGAVGALGLLTMAVSAVMSIYSFWNNSQKEARANAIEAGKAAEDQVNSITSLKKAFEEAQSEYEKTGQKTDTLTSSADALVAKLQEEGIIVEKVDDAYKYLADHMEEVNQKTREMLELDIAQYYQALSAAETEFVESFRKAFYSTGSFITGNKYTIDLVLDITSEEGKDVYDYLKGMGFNVTESTVTGEPHLGINVDLSTPESSIKEYGTLLEILTSLSDKYTTAYLNSTDWYEELTSGLNTIKETARGYETAKERVDVYEGVLNKTTESTEEAANANDELEFHIIDLEEELGNLTNRYSELEGKLSGIQSAYGTLISAVDEYNDTGIMTSEMLEKLLELEPEYISLLEVKNGQLILNKDGVDALVNSTDTYMQQMVALKIAEEAEALATNLQAAAKNQLTLEEFKAQAATAAFSSELYTAVLNMIQGKGTAEELAHALGDVAASAQLSGEWLEYFNGQFQSIFSGYSQLLSLPRSFKLPSSSYKPASSTGKSGSSASDEIKKQKEALQAEIKAYQDREKEIKNYYAELKKTTQDYYDGLIDELKRVQEENSRINAQLDYYNSRQKIITNLEQAQARSGVEWREKEMEYQQQLMDLDEEWNRKQENWSIEDRISELNNLKEIAVKQIEDAMDSAVDEIEKVIAALQEQVSQLSSATGSSVASGIISGVVEGTTVFNNAFTDIMQEWEKILDSAKKSVETMRGEFVDPKTVPSLNALHDELLNILPKQAEDSASRLYKAYMQQFITPTKQSIEEMFRDAMAKAQSLNTITSGPVALAKILGNTLPKSNTNNSVNMTNYISNTSAADNAVNAIMNRLNSFR